MYPLKWDGQVLIFDTESQAQRFLDSCLNHSMHPLEFFDGAFIKVANKITNEKGSIDASHKFVRYDANKHQDYLEDYR